MNKKKIFNFSLIILCLTCMILGLWMIFDDFNNIKEAPINDRDIIASTNQKATGEKTAKVEIDIENDVDFEDSETTIGEAEKIQAKTSYGHMSPEKMKKNTLFIPEAGTYTRLYSKGISNNGQLYLPKNPKKSTLWSGSTSVGSTKGPTLISGHINWNNIRGSLWNLHSIKEGNLAFVKDNKGEVYEFQLESLKKYDKNSLPKQIWDINQEKKLYVITCGGKIVRNYKGGRTYQNNIVAVFKPNSTTLK